MTRQIFLNLPAADLSKSRDFFVALGFTINEHFSDPTSACVVGSDTIFVQLHTHEKFKPFTPNAICDAKRSTQVLLCLSCASREEVNELVRKALAAGGNTYNEPQDHEFMYGHGFQDPDGHIWELVHWTGVA